MVELSSSAEKAIGSSDPPSAAKKAKYINFCATCCYLSVFSLCIVINWEGLFCEPGSNREPKQVHCCDLTFSFVIWRNTE